MLLEGPDFGVWAEDPRELGGEGAWRRLAGLSMEMWRDLRGVKPWLLLFEVNMGLAVRSVSSQ